MSYEKVKSIKANKDFTKIEVTSASNNVFPLDYYKWEYGSDCKFNKLPFLFKDMLDGNLQPNISCNDGKYFHAITMVKNAIKNDGVDKFELYETFCKQRNEKRNENEGYYRSQEYANDIVSFYGQYYDIFVSALKDKKDTIIADGYYYVSKICPTKIKLTSLKDEAIVVYKGVAIDTIQYYEGTTIEKI